MHVQHILGELTRYTLDTVVDSVSKGGRLSYQVLGCRLLIVLCTEPNESIVKQEQFERVTGGYQNIDPEITLEALDQQWPLQVFLYHQLLGGCDPLHIVMQGNPNNRLNIQYEYLTPLNKRSRPS